MTATALALGAIAAVLGALRSGPESSGEPEIEAAVITALEADAAAGRLPTSLDERRRVWETRRDDRAALLALAWVPEKVEGRLNELDGATEVVLDDAGYRAYQDNRLVVIDWELVERTSDGARAVFTGQMEYAVDDRSGWSREPLTRYEVLLRETAPGEWRMVDYFTDQLESA